MREHLSRSNFQVSPGRTALIISHHDQDCLYRHNVGIANQHDAENS